jgi:CBS-domain-containing membrane protein
LPTRLTCLLHLLSKLFQQFNGGGHPKAASATAKLADESEASGVLQRLVDELIETGLTKQLTVGDFMQSPVLSAKPTMTEKQVEDLFIRYDVRALPVVNDNNEVIGLVSYKEVTAARMRLLNKQEKRLRQMEKAAGMGKSIADSDRPLESALKGWMKQHVQIVEASTTMAEVEQILLETDGESNHTLRSVVLDYYRNDFSPLSTQWDVFLWLQITRSS